MSSVAFVVAMGALVIGLISIIAGAFNLLRMGRFIRPDMPTVAGFYVFPRADDFADSEGLTYRGRCLRWFAVAVLCMAIFVALIVNTPNFEL